jgi:4'-phosphopantetheinyl transferase EntD
MSSQGLLSRLLPPVVACRETAGDVLSGPRFDAEESVIAEAVGSRRREFVTARACARLALSDLGVTVGAIPRGPGGCPVWPARLTGSLTHCTGLRAAAVGWRRQLDGIGIDAEPAVPLPPDVLDLVADRHERAHLAQLATGDSTVPWDGVLFSAKESVYKAQYPSTGRWLDFSDVRVIIDPAGSFRVSIRPGDAGSAAVERAAMSGRWAVDGGLLATAAWVAVSG